jgi:transposase
MADESGKLATGLTWNKVPVDGTMATHPGIYCLRSNETGWDEEKLWRTYTMLTDLESVFRSLKSELGLRPVYHSTEGRADGHLFITVLAYQAVQVLRTKLKKADIHDSWASLRDTLSVQRRVTASFRQRDGRTLNVRKSTVAEPDLMKIYLALETSHAPGGTKKLIS